MPGHHQAGAGHPSRLRPSAPPFLTSLYENVAVSQPVKCRGDQKPQFDAPGRKRQSARELRDPGRIPQ